MNGIDKNMKATATQLGKQIQELELEQYALELEVDGLTVVPPKVTGVDTELMDRCVEVLLERFTELSDGCPITLEDGPLGELKWSTPEGKAPTPSQTLIQQILQLDRCFRNLFVNPVADVLIGHLFGHSGNAERRSWRLSSTNAFVKWQGEHGYGEHLGLHCDQGANPLPWGRTALTANATWCLTDYAKEDGALAFVPGSHKSNGHPNHPFASPRAIPVECPKGSVIIWPGTTWHGAFPKQTKGLRLNAVAYYRHHAVLPQENLKVTMADQLCEDSDDPSALKELIGLDDPFPYSSQSYPFPKLAAS